LLIKQIILSVINIKMNISNEDFNQETFIYNESDKLEFKESFSNSLMQKYLETICGFLHLCAF
jgi:hypothetical protein